MADSHSSRPDVNLTGDARPSPSGSRRRRSHYEQQRTSRPGRSVSDEYPASLGAVSSRPADRRASYSLPDDYENLTEIAAPDPLPHQERRASIEEVQSSHSPLSRSSRRSRGTRSSYQEPDYFENLNEVAAPEPLPRAERKASLEQAARSHSPVLSRKRTKRSTHRDEWQRALGDEQYDQEEEALYVTAPIQESELPTSSTSEQLARVSPEPDLESLAVPPPSAQRESEDHTSPAKRLPFAVPTRLTELYTISYLIFFAFLGTLARLGIQWITFYPGDPITTPIVWANFVGSLIFGFLAEDQGLFEEAWSDPDIEEKLPDGDTTPPAAREKNVKAEQFKRKKAIPLYIGLSTGFCGSCTSFSSSARDFFLALSNSLPMPFSHPRSGGGTSLTTSTNIPRNGGYSFLAWASVCIYTIALSMGALMIGAHLALLLAPITPRFNVTYARKFFDPLAVFLGFGCWIGAVFLAIWPPDRPGGPDSRGSWSNETWRGEVIFALVFAPLGCLLRFYTSLKLNALVPAFPLGTFAVNMLGTAVESMCFDIQHVGVGVKGVVGGGLVGCQVLQGVMDGFCGCLTTISTWVGEIRGLRRRHAHIYGLCSIVGATCLTIAIMGSVRWTVGFSDPVCNTGFPSKTTG